MENKIWMTGKEITETFGILASELWDACGDGKLKAYDDMRNEVEINFLNYCIKKIQMNFYKTIDKIKELQDGRTYNALKEEYRIIIFDTLFKSDDIQTCFSHYFPKIAADIEKDAQIARLEQELASAKSRIAELQAATNAVPCDGEGLVRLACDMRREGQSKKEIYDHLRSDGKWLSRPQASSLVYPHAVPVQDRTITKFGDRLK